MKAKLNLNENTILMDCTPQELAGLLSLLQPRPKQGLPSSDHHPEEPPAAPAEPVQDPEPAPQVPEPVPNEPEPVSQEPETVIPPEPAERGPLGKAIERLKKEKTAGRPTKYQPVYARNAEGDVIYCDSVAEMAIKLGVTVQCVNQSIKHNYNCKGYKIKKDDPKTVL